ncbi:MAG TPA: hypothetical protein VMS19_06360, partial [Methyloceanibacter sp.]|nr:hypothetical protein [Methyloceanibacter sp.]
LVNDGHYLSSLQYPLRDGGGDSADGAQGTLLEMRQCLAGPGGDRAGQAHRHYSAATAPRRASSGADGAASCSRGTASRRGATSSTLRAASGLDGCGHAHGPLSWRTLCSSRSRSRLRRQAEQRSVAEWRTGAGTSGEDW